MENTTDTRRIDSRMFSPEINDEELAAKAIRGIMDARAGRAAPLDTVRQRVMSRYASTKADA